MACSGVGGLSRASFLVPISRTRSITAARDACELRSQTLTSRFCEASSALPCPCERVPRSDGETTGAPFGKRECGLCGSSGSFLVADVFGDSNEVEVPPEQLVVELQPGAFDPCVHQGKRFGRRVATPHIEQCLGERQLDAAARAVEAGLFGEDPAVEPFGPRHVSAFSRDVGQVLPCGHRLSQVPVWALAARSGLPRSTVGPSAIGQGP